MIKLSASVLAGAAMLLALPSHGAPIILDFEGVGDTAAIEDFYNGGTDSEGNSGTDYGVEFSGNTLGLVDADAGGEGNFANEPSPNTIMFWTDASSAILNFAAGFEAGFSFFYTSAVEAAINVYSGLGATGDLLGTLDLAAQHNQNCSGDPTGTFCNWDAIGVEFDGVARSIDFAGSASFTGYDDITFGSATPGNEPVSVSEPSTLVLLGLGLGLIGYRNRRVIRPA